MLTPARLGAIAALGEIEVDALVRPRIALLSTGNEITAPGQPLAPGQIYDVNRFHDGSRSSSATGRSRSPYRTAADTIEDLSRAVDECLHEDVLLFSGGSSVGERDLILDVLAARGEVLFHGIAVKPGKPMAFGRIEGRLFFGMPGYPTSCLTNGYALVVPALRKMAGLPPWSPRVLTLPLGARIVSAAGRHQFYTVRIEDGVAVPAFKSSGEHHQHVARGRLHRNRRSDGHRRKGRVCGCDLVLSRRQRLEVSALTAWFRLAPQKFSVALKRTSSGDMIAVGFR